LEGDGAQHRRRTAQGRLGGRADRPRQPRRAARGLQTALPPRAPAPWRPALLQRPGRAPLPMLHHRPTGAGLAGPGSPPPRARRRRAKRRTSRTTSPSGPSNCSSTATTPCASPNDRATDRCTSPRASPDTPAGSRRTCPPHGPGRRDRPRLHAPRRAAPLTICSHTLTTTITRAAPQRRTAAAVTTRRRPPDTLRHSASERAHPPDRPPRRHTRRALPNESPPARTATAYRRTEARRTRKASPAAGDSVPDRGSSPDPSGPRCRERG
jgi:hypothetical protein